MRKRGPMSQKSVKPGKWDWFFSSWDHPHGGIKLNSFSSYVCCLLGGRILPQEIVEQYAGYWSVLSRRFQLAFLICYSGSWTFGWLFLIKRLVTGRGWFLDILGVICASVAHDRLLLATLVLSHDCSGAMCLIDFCFSLDRVKILTDK